jgi:L-asparaginase II
MSELIVDVYRGDIVESAHRVHVAVVHAERGLVFATGDSGCVSFVRSAVKMFQALPMVESGALGLVGLTPEEVALATASHGGEPFHVAAVRSMLDKVRVTENALACGPVAPLHGPSAEALRAAGLKPSRLHNNCSGKHAGMLAFTVYQRWVTNGYHKASHPTQGRVKETLAFWTGLDTASMRWAIDGCGLPTFALPLDAVARACARFAAAAGDGRLPPATIVSAMTTHPEYVAGTDRLCTDLMRTTSGRLFAKVGAEGYYCAGVPAMRLGVAVKVADGAWRAVEPAVLAALRHVDAISTSEHEALARYARPAITNTRGEKVGRIQARIT